ncbi:SPOR domain-containing protein [Paenibacillus sp. y28]|uniref:SPOR domain-containing protein n=1 Tax=Paenibacillus sp. y28 TaxID=3129110 RepID=UPI00301635D1
MNKARITYRFDRSGTRLDSTPAPRDVLPPQELAGPLTPMLHEEEEHVGRSPQSRSDRDVIELRPVVTDVQEINPYVNDYEAWSSPFDAETQRLEQLIRSTELRENRGAREEDGGRHREEREPVWLPDSREPWQRMPGSREQGGRIGADSEPAGRERPEFDYEYGFYERPAASRQTYRAPFLPVSEGPGREPSRVTPWLKIIASVTGAVATGALFGFFVLSMFASEPNDVQKTAEQLVRAPFTGSTGTGASAGGAAVKTEGEAVPASAAAAAGSAIAVNLAGNSYTVLQGGVFSNQQGAEALQADLRKKGLAAVTESGDKYTVYVALAPGRSEAQALSQLVQSKQQEVILKQLAIPAAAKIRWSGKAQDSAAVSGFFAQGEKLMQQLSALTSKHLGQNAPGAPDETELKSAQAAHQTWIGAAAQMEAGIPADQKAGLQKMTQSLNSAVKALEEYKKSPSAALLWQAQSELIQYAVSEKSLLSALAVQ